MQQEGTGRKHTTTLSKSESKRKERLYELLFLFMLISLRSDKGNILESFLDLGKHFLISVE
ncbi:MAG: hypothetical protein C4545_04775 [Anaerolineaceae bacterium]|nr:MAG: hypothetical protein C4545_04775 [Anaerolineaceae bacterium]